MILLLTFPKKPFAPRSGDWRRGGREITAGRRGFPPFYFTRMEYGVE